METLAEQYALTSQELGAATIALAEAQDRRNKAVLAQIAVIHEGYDPFMRHEATP